MSLTTKSAVARVIEVDTDINLTPYIDAASELVTECCGNSGYSQTRLEMIETWLAAHLYAVRDPRAQSEGVSSLNTTYQGRTGMHFESSIYGQHALLLDTKGGLAALQEQIKNGLTLRAPTLGWLGKNDSTSMIDRTSQQIP